MCHVKSTFQIQRRARSLLHRHPELGRGGQPQAEGGAERIRREGTEGITMNDNL